jgi:hypothetical protein
MQSRKLWPNGVLDYAVIGRSSFVSAALFGLAAVLLATQATSQTRLTRDFDAPPQRAAADETPDAPSFQAGASLSAPVPTVEEADLASPLPISLSALAAAQASNQSPSESSSQSLPAPTTPAAAKIKPQHHGLGVALAIVGTATLAVGIAAYALGGADICANEKSGGCKEARDAGLVLMPVGGGVAVTGFYFTFHR